MTAHRALIVGAAGQDGALLARHLLGLGYGVAGTSRRPAVPGEGNLARLGIDARVQMHVLNPRDVSKMRAVVQSVAPDQVYYLAAQSSVALSFERPSESLEGPAGFATLLEATRGSDVRIFNAGSGDCFGEASADRPITEATPFAPRSPYAIGKVAQHQLARLTRETEGRFIATGFLFNHESPLRPAQFVTSRVVAAAKRIAAGSDEVLKLGDIDVVRDWGWAPDYVDAMHRMLMQPEPADFVIATGRSVPLSHFIERVFGELGLDWRRHVRGGTLPPRPTDIRDHHADPTLAAERLGWRAAHDVDALVPLLLAHD